jgi:CheY-like chemotaxis protein/tetratricopeptide (TPR) repeat protein
MHQTILCVEDDRTLCRLLAKALGADGYRVLTAFDGDEALRVFEDSEPDLVLLDLILPRRDGFGVLEAIRGSEGAASPIPVVLLSGGAASREIERRAVALGAADLLAKPVALDVLRSVVAKHLGEKRREKLVPAAEPARQPAPQPLDSLAGSLERFPFSALIHHLHGLRAKGVLHLECGRKKKWVEFRDGYPIAVRGNLVHECLGNLLVRDGRVTAAREVESRRRMKPGQLQGEVLVAMEAISHEDVALALRAQAEQKLFEVFTWSEGSFRFELGAKLQRANALPIESSPANLILSGVRKRLPLAQIDQLFQRNGNALLRPADSAFYRLQEIELDAEQQALLRSLDGRTTLASVAQAEEATRRTVYALVAAGLVQLQRSDLPEPEAAPLPRGATRSAKPARAAASLAAPAPVAGPTESELRARFAALADRFRGQNHFEVLGVGESAEPFEVHAAFERLAEGAHPDRLVSASQAVRALAAEVFATLQRAHDTLMSPMQRQAYLLELRRQERENAERQEGRNALDAELQFQRGEAALRSRQFQQALLAFGKALELYPDEGEYHAHYGWALHLCHPEDESMTREAMEHVRQGIKLASDRERPYLFMGRLCKATGRRDVAAKMFRRAIQIQPNCADASSELRLLELREKKSKGLVERLFRR